MSQASGDRLEKGSAFRLDASMTSLRVSRQYERLSMADDKAQLEIVTPIRRPQRQEMSSLTDLGNAERLVREHKDSLRFSRPLGWLYWDGRRWARDDTGVVNRKAKQTIRAMA